MHTTDSADYASLNCQQCTAVRLPFHVLLLKRGMDCCFFALDVQSCDPLFFAPLKKIEMVLVPLGAYHFLLSTNNVTVLLFFGIVWLYQWESMVEG